jgi:hypothetical protein
MLIRREFHRGFFSLADQFEKLPLAQPDASLAVRLRVRAARCLSSCQRSMRAFGSVPFWKKFQNGETRRIPQNAWPFFWNAAIHRRFEPRCHSNGRPYSRDAESSKRSAFSRRQ